MKNVKSFVLLFAVILAAVGCCLAVSVGNEAGGATDTGKNSGVVRFRWAAGKSPVLNGLVRTFEDEGEMSGPMGVAFSPDGKYALSGCNTLKLWDIATGKLLRTFARSGGAGNSVAFSPDGKYALSGSYHDKTLTLWDIATGKLLHTFEGHGHSVTSVAFSPDGKYALSGSYHDKTLKLWDIATGQLVRTFEGHVRNVNSVAYSPDGKYALSGSADSTLKLWDIATGQLVRTFEGHNGEVTSVAYSPDGKYALSGSADSTLKLWDIATGQLVRTFKGHNDEVTSVAFSPDGQYALSGSYDKTLKLWDIATGQLVRTFEGHGNSVTSVAFSPDGKYTLSGSYENTLKLWYAAPNYAYAVASELRADYPVPALPGKMEQGRYERKSSFDARVEKTKADYERAVKAYNARLPAGPSAGEFGRAFAAFYGKPRIASTSYAADTGIFTFKVSASGAQDKREYVFELKQPVPNAEAENFEPALKSARPVVYFRLANGAISPSGAKVEVNGKKYDAMPAAETVQAAPEVADLSGLIGTTIRPGQIEISAIATNTDNPKLAAKAAELAKLRKENADKATIAEMEAEISKLKDEGVPTYTSDVDAANFKNAERGEDFALIVGVESYEQKDLPKADYAERDAEAVKQYLLALGLPERNIKLLKGSGATYAKLRSYLESWLPKNVKEDSRVFFYFSGHGAPDAKTGSAYLLPWDGNPEFLETSAYPLKEAYENLGKLKARQVVVALDSCFSGAGGRSVIQKGARPLVVVRNINALPQSLTLLAAASGDEITGGLEEQGHGIFTYHLLKGIYSGIADSSKLCKYFKPKVQDAAARQNRTQTPICKGADVDFLR